jgi:endonuclease/exonuclease/phosphatase family metal-dependent hydrolase
MSLTLVSYNVCGVPLLGHPRRRVREICRRLREEVGGLDVLALQEVETMGLARLFQRELPALEYTSHVPGWYGPAGGLVTLSSAPVETLEYVQLSRVCRRYWSGWAVGGMHKGILVTQIGDWIVLNLHFSPGRGDAPVQRPQVQALIDTAERYDARVTVVVGDTNILRGEPLYHKLLRDTGLCDPHDGKPTYIGRHERGPGCIDYTLIPDHRAATVVRAEVLFWDGVRPMRSLRGGLSDHAGVLVQMG